MAKLRKYRVIIIGEKQANSDEIGFINKFEPTDKQKAAGISGNEYLKIEVVEVPSSTGFSLSSGSLQRKVNKKFNIWKQNPTFNWLLEAMEDETVCAPLKGDATKMALVNNVEGDIKIFPCRPSKQWNKKEKRYEQDTVAVLLRNGDTDYVKKDRVVENFSIFFTADNLEEGNEAFVEAARLKEKKIIEAHLAEDSEPKELEVIHSETEEEPTTATAAAPVQSSGVPA